MTVTATHMANPHRWHNTQGPDERPFHVSGQPDLVICCPHEAETYRLTLLVNALQAQLAIAREHINGLEATRRPLLISDVRLASVSAEGTAQ